MVYKVLRLLALCLLKLWNRLEVNGLEHVPSQGKLIVIANHVSVLDPIVLGASIPRQIRFMAKEELFHIPVLKSLITHLGAFPVNRSKTDFQAVKNSLKVLANEEVLGIFPEGGTRKNVATVVFRPGTAAIALKSKSPVLPVAITGTRSLARFFLFGKLKVNIGPVISWHETHQGKLQDEQIEQLTREMEQAVESLKNP
ncbi:MAG: 1-acyl-sn-glycerol-3-phosphate acyltransferase [Clostridia bacterium]|nr:1-acyl-sn-glycerol-3-phosphate acyltransferase [Clostridia bacterium]